MSSRFAILGDDNQITFLDDHDAVLQHIMNNGGVNRLVRWNEILLGVQVSTIFIGGRTTEWRLDRLFETAIITGDQIEPTRVYSSWDAAVRGHDEVIQEILERNL